MASIIVRRAQPFQRGHVTIQILLDGKVVGTLFKDEPLTITTTDGPHLLKARMLGMNGAVHKLELRADETATLQVSGVLLPKNYWWETLLFIAIILMPGRISNGPYYWPVMAAYLVVMLGLGYSAHIKMKRVLRLEEVSSTVATSAAATAI